MCSECILLIFFQKSTIKNEEYDVEMEKVKKDREVAMKQKEALVKTLSEAANALESSLKVLV